LRPVASPRRFIARVSRKIFMDTAIAATVNPFAGLHAVTASPEEREAVRRATETALGEAPYYLERFGERGRLFGGSDGGWLVTVCAGDLPYIERQVLWLGRVLSPRGVPRYLLQRYLRILHDEVARSIPDSGARCAALLHAGALLDALQRRHLPEAEARALAVTFELRADAGSVARLPGMGRILVAAVVDEAGGIGGAVASVVDWAADPARFPAPWVNAVQATVSEARGRVRRV
jgi:hypothetical protein